MAPPHLGPVKDECDWSGHDVPSYQHTNYEATSSANSIQSGEVLTSWTKNQPTMDMSASASLLDLSGIPIDDEWLLSTSMAGSIAKDTLAKDKDDDWFKSRPSREIGNGEKKMLVNILDSMAENSGGSDSVFLTPQFIINSHKNSPLLPMPSNPITLTMDRLMDDNEKTEVRSYLEAHLHSPTLSDHCPSPTNMFSLSPEESAPPPPATNRTFNSSLSPAKPRHDRGNSPPWPLHVSTSTPTTKKCSYLGDKFPPVFEAHKLKLSPPKSRCLNTTETKISITVDDADICDTTSPDSKQLNITETKETPLNTTQPIVQSQLNTTQTFTTAPECEANTTQTLCKANTTQTLFVEGPVNTTEGPVNTTQTLDASVLNTTETYEKPPSENSSNSFHDAPISVNTCKNSVVEVAETQDSETDVCIQLDDLDISGTNSSIGVVDATDGTRDIVAENGVGTVNKDPLKESYSKKSGVDSNLRDPLSNCIITPKPVPDDDDTTFNTRHDRTPSDPSSPKVKTNEDEGAFVRNSSFTSTYKVSPVLDSKGKNLPGPGEKVDDKKKIQQELVNTSQEEKKFKIPISQNKPLGLSAAAKPIMRRSVSMKPSIPAGKSVLGMKQEQLFQNQTTFKTVPSVGLSKLSKNFKHGIGELSEIPTEKPKSSNSIKSRLSTMFKSSQVLKAPGKTKPSESSNSSQPINDATTEVSLQQPNQPSRIVDVRLQPRIPIPPSSLTLLGGSRPALTTPSTRSGLRPPSVRTGPSGIARLAGRKAMSTSRLPVPGITKNV